MLTNTSMDTLMQTHTYTHVQTNVLLKEKKNNYGLERLLMPFPQDESNISNRQFEMWRVGLGRVRKTIKPYNIKMSVFSLLEMDEHTNLMPRDHMCPVSLPLGFAS